MRHTRLTTMILATVLASTAWLTVTAAPQTDRQAEAQLQDAWNKAFVDGDVKAAIEQYRKIADGANRGAAAKALLEMGRLYERQGSADAESVYQRILRQFPTQIQVVEEARARLTILGAENPVIDIAAGPRRVGRSYDRGQAISPDGRYLFQPDGSVSVKDLATGETWRLNPNQGGVIRSDTRLGIPYAAFSSGGNEIAFALAEGNQPPHSARVEMWVTSLPPKAGSGKRVFTQEDISNITPFGWSLDGVTVFALLTRRDETNVIAAISIASGDFRAIKSLEWRWPTRLSLSPDGRYIAYDAPVDRQSANRDIFVLPIDGSPEVMLTNDPARDASPVWTPGGEAVVFTSDRQGSSGLWMTPIAAGRPAGEAQLLRRDTGSWWPIGFSRDGIFHYQVLRDSPGQISLSEIDSETGRIPRTPTVLRGPGDGDYAPAYSPDGAELAYFSRKGAGFRSDSITSSGFLTLVIRSLTTGNEREFSTAFTDVHSSTWLADGSLAFAGRTDNGSYPYRQYSLHRIDVRTGKDLTTHAVAASYRGGWVQRSGALAGAGTQIYYLKDVGAPNRPPFPKSIMAYDIATQRERTLVAGDLPLLDGLAGDGIDSLAVSPDGRQLAVAQRTGSVPRRLFLVPTAGGTPRQIAVTSVNWRVVRWSKDGTEILMQKENGELWWVDADSGGMRQVGTGTVPPIEAVHPDGTRFVSLGEARVDTSGHGVWIDPGVLPNSERRRIFLARMDPTAARVLGPATAIRQSLVLVDQAPSWLPDGKRIAFQRVNGAGFDLVVRSLATGEETIHSAAGWKGLDRRSPTWLHDGKGLLRVSLPATSPLIERLGIDNPKLKESTQRSMVHALSRDNRTVYVVPSLNPTSRQVAVFDVATGTETGQFSIPVAFNAGRNAPREMALSPDGKTLAMWTGQALSRIGTDGKGFKELLTAQSAGAEAGTKPVWTRDGKAILIGLRRNGRTWRLMRIPAAGGTPVFAGLETTGLPFFFDISPDGTQIVFDGIAPVLRATAR